MQEGSHVASMRAPDNRGVIQRIDGDNAVVEWDSGGGSIVPLAELVEVADQ